MIWKGNTCTPALYYVCFSMLILANRSTLSLIAYYRNYAKSKERKEDKEIIRIKKDLNK